MTARNTMLIAAVLLVGLPGCAVQFPELHESMRAFDHYYQELHCNDHDLRNLLPGADYYDKARQEECDRLRPMVMGGYKPVAGFERAWAYDPATGTTRSTIIRSGSVVPAGTVVIPSDGIPGDRRVK